MNKKEITSWIFVLLWMVVIFVMSHTSTNASYETSKEVISTVVGNTAPSTMVLGGTMTLNKLVRKLAHAGEYFILSGLVINALAQYSISKMKIVSYTIVFCFIYACGDEIHQFFVGRIASMLDVMIDMVGAFLALIGYAMFSIHTRKIFTRNK